MGVGIVTWGVGVAALNDLSGFTSASGTRSLVKTATAVRTRSKASIALVPIGARILDDVETSKPLRTDYALFREGRARNALRLVHLNPTMPI